MSELSAFSGLIDLASAALGGRALAASDDFFASKDSLLLPTEAVFIPGKYTDRGKWMDGWESRRRRVPGHDWCIVQLGVPGRVRGLDIDTSHFLGNHPPFASVEACTAHGVSDPQALQAAAWTEILPEVALQRGAHNLSAVADDRVYTHLLLRIYPAGGVARLRVYGAPSPAPRSDAHDLAALVHGGRALACSDMFFSPMNNLLMPGEPADMGGGWETRRSRPPGEDWVIIALGQTGALQQLRVGTLHFKGNPPQSCAVDAIRWPGAPAHALIASPDWQRIAAAPLRPHHIHALTPQDPGPWTHLRLRIQPDGGISRLRAIGTPTEAPSADPLLVGLNACSEAAAIAALSRCCGAHRWAQGMAAARPFVSRAHLHGHAEVLWWRLAPADWLEAFSHHPRIGADPDKLRQKFAATADWSASEQAGVAAASEAVIQALAAGNRAYEDRYGFLFIVCASGLRAEQLLARLQARMHNEPHIELARAAGEQAKITRLRLEKLTPP